jgi:hypothetical protein
MLRRGHALAFVVIFVACGGGGVGQEGPGAKSPGEDEGGLGEFALSHGGIPSLGQQGEDVFVADGLRFDLVEKDKPVKLDGVLTEWPACTPARIVVKGTPGPRTSFSAVVQYDASKLFIGGEVGDDKLVRTARFGEGEDHASLLLAFPTASGSLAAYEIGLYAGKPGESEGEVRLHGAEIPGSKIVEAPTSNGYTFEAQIPWSAFPQARLVRVGLRGAARYYNASSPGTIDAVVATADGDTSSASRLPQVPTEPELSLIEQLLVPKGLLSTAPKLDMVGDVAGDAMMERIAVYDRYLVILGPGYLDGKSFFYKDLGGELVKLELRGVTGRGKDDVLLRRRVTVSDATRERFEVLSVLTNAEPVTTFAHEISIVSGSKRLDNAVRVGAREIDVAVEPAVGWDASSYQELIADDVDPILFPWGSVKSQAYVFDGGHFTKKREVAQAGQLAAPGVPPPPVNVHPPEPPTPAVHKGGDLSRQVLDAYKRDHGVSADTQPTSDLSVQVAGDSRPERVVLIGKDVVVFGPGFRGGTGYANLTLSQFADAGDIHELTARDLTGDGNADLVVRGVRHVNVPGSSDVVDEDVMLVYQVSSSAITRIFAVETGREQAGKRVQGLVQFIPSRSKKTFDILVAPGRVTGWTQSSYPWQQDQPGQGALEPLLLPWGGTSSLRYSWNGTEFARP